MNGPLVNVNHTVNGGNNNGSTLQASMNPNANLFVPRVIYTQHPQQVHFMLGDIVNVGQRRLHQA